MAQPETVKKKVQMGKGLLRWKEREVSGEKLRALLIGVQLNFTGDTNIYSIFKKKRKQSSIVIAIPYLRVQSL